MQEIRIEHLLPRRVKAARALAGLTVLELATATGISTHQIYRAERGEYVPDAIELSTIAKVTGQTMAYFLGDEEAA